MPRRPAHPYSPATDEPALSRADRRAAGVYYTPPEIARQIVDLTLAPLRKASREPLRVLDPACGAGALLAEANRYGAELFGIDCDPGAVEQASQTLGRGEVWCGDALFDSQLESLALFDAIVANPPYVNIRRLNNAQGTGYVQQLRSRFRTARGNFDLYVLFLERALELLRPGGRCGVIVPNKWQTLDYARPCRELLAREATIDQVIDLSAERVFRQASVYPQVLVFTKRSTTAKPAIPATIPRGTTIDVESCMPTIPLGQLAQIHCGTAGFAARRIADRLLDEGDSHRHEAPQLADFITSGNIDRYQIRLGHVRYLKQTYVKPQLSLVTPELTSAKRRLFAGPKIVIAGLSKRIEAAWDEAGLALGVQVFALSDWQVDPHYLLALLNSKLLSYLFRTRFAAKRLAGGYLAINKGQLVQLPIAVAVGQDLSCLISAGRVLSCEPSPADDAAIDQLVYRLYRLTDAEIAQVESHFPEPAERAA
jgi:SAM-dependent methyltransferase